MLDFMVFQQLFGIWQIHVLSFKCSLAALLSSVLISFSHSNFLGSRLVGKSCYSSENKVHTIVKLLSFRNISILKIHTLIYRWNT